MTEHEWELDALWWLLFDALGHVAGVDESGAGAVGRLIRPDGTEMVAGDAGSFIRFYWNIPDWLTDEGAALMLCVSIIQRKYADTQEKWQLSIASTYPAQFGCMFVFCGIVQQPGLSLGATAAEALSRLALEALA